MEVSQNPFSDTPVHVFKQSHNTPKDLSVDKLGHHALEEQLHVAEKPQHEWGDVIVLIGTSSAGKSSIISEVMQQKPGTIEHGVDLDCVNIPMAFLHENHPEEMEYFQRVIEPTEMEVNYPGYIIDYITSKEPTFKSDVSLEDKNAYGEIFKKVNESLLTEIPGDKLIPLMLDQVVTHSKQAKQVIFDTILINEVAQHILLNKHPSITYVLVYVPFQSLAERVVRRNDEAVREGDLNNLNFGFISLKVRVITP